MRLIFPNETRPKAAAKTIAAETGVALAKVQQALARAAGYRDWHELTRSFSDQLASALDSSLDSAEVCGRQVSLAHSLSDQLGISGGDALHAIVVSHLTGDRKPSIWELLSARVQLFRRMELPVVARRERGAIGKLKVSGRYGEVVILKEFGRATRVITHKSGRAGVADFEYMTPTKPADLFIPMRLYLAYGMWTEADGAKVLFSRDYCPMWRLIKDRKPERLKPWARIAYVNVEFFWGDREFVRWPWRDEKMHHEEIDRLHKFGISGLPRLVEALPLVVLRGDIGDYVEAVEEMRRQHEILEVA